MKDTIAAIATGLTNSGISIIRISGSEALAVAEKVFRKKKLTGEKTEYIPFDLHAAASHTAHYGFIKGTDERIIDEVILLVFKAPASYTAEDSVEIDCHGGIYVTKKVLESVLAAGARLAEPGEFTKRAFLNGRIDLSRAEAVSDLINSKNMMALDNSLKQLSGAEFREITALRDVIMSDCAYIEAALDDPEHISLDGFDKKLDRDMSEVLRGLKKLYASAENGRLMSEGINTVIAGKPNSGKSTLLNAMLGEDRAIVTDIEGTTRDTLEETVIFDGVTLNIIDTAGIRDTDNTVEKLGVDRALAAIDSADLVLYVIDGTRQLDSNDRFIIQKLIGRQCICLINKSDLEQAEMVPEWNAIGSAVLEISAKKGLGLEELGHVIRDMFFGGKVTSDDEMCITSLRHKECIKSAIDSIEAVRASVDAGMSEDFYTIDLLAAYTSLGQITGEDTGEDLIDRIFRDFCMGK